MEYAAEALKNAKVTVSQVDDLLEQQDGGSLQSSRKLEEE